MASTHPQSRDPRDIPERVLWTLIRADETVEARTRLVPLGPELRIYATSSSGAELKLLWSRVFGPSDGGSTALGALAEEKRASFLALGWTSAADRRAHQS